MQFDLHRNSKKLLLIMGIVFVSIGILGLLIWSSDDLSVNKGISYAVTNRTVNTYFGALITAMALIITLTSNLYSPALSKVFVSHPLTILGISYILIANLFITIANLITPTHPWFQLINFISLSMTIIAMLGMIPFLFLISRFVKPSYFVPLLGRYSLNYISHFHKVKSKKVYQQKEIRNLFSLIDVINNMASTAIIRNDRGTLKVVIDELFQILDLIISYQNSEKHNQTWRFEFEHFTTGLSDEGQYYLKKYKTWPEAYILSKILENAQAITEKDNDIIPYICRKITNTIDLAVEKENNKLIELNLMILNSIINESINSNNQSKFSSVMYYYRINTELLIDNDELREFSINNFIFYGKKSLSKGQLRAAKNFIFDLGRILHYLCFENEDLALTIYETKIKEVLSVFIQHEELREECEKSIVKSFWVLYSQNYNKITSQLKKDFLVSNYKHAQILKRLLAVTNPLNKEYNETLVSPDYMSGMAFKFAKDFLSEFDELKDVS